MSGEAIAFRISSCSRCTTSLADSRGRRFPTTPTDRNRVAPQQWPGVHLVEHPELVAQRIIRFAKVVGRERVIAGTDCGFGTSGAGDEVHPDVAWAKLRGLVDGARFASQRLF